MIAITFHVELQLQYLFLLSPLVLVLQIHTLYVVLVKLLSTSFVPPSVPWIPNHPKSWLSHVGRQTQLALLGTVQAHFVMD